MSGEAEETKVGRKTKYTPELSELICEQIAAGNTLKSICALKGMPSQTTVHRWRTEPDKTGFRDLYGDSKLIHCNVLFDSTLDIARGDTADSIVKINHDRLLVNTIWLYIDKANPKKYSDKSGIEEIVSSDLDLTQLIAKQFESYKAIVAVTPKKNCN